MTVVDEFEFSLDNVIEDDLASELPEMILFYSTYGSGKTWLAASASEVEGLYPVLIIDTEGSTVGTISQFDKSRIDVIRPDKKYPGKEWVATKKILNDLLTKTHKYKTVVIDTADEVFEWAKQHGHKADDGYAQWTYVHEEFTAPKTGLFSRLKKADFLVILNVHEKKESAGDDLPPSSDFQWQGQGKAQLGKYPDMVGYLTRDTNSSGVSTTTLHTAPTKRAKAKNRFDLPAKITDPTMQGIYDLITKNNKENK